MLKDKEKANFEELAKAQSAPSQPQEPQPAETPVEGSASPEPTNEPTNESAPEPAQPSEPPVVPDGYVSKEELAKYESRIKELESANPYANEFIAELNKKAAAGVDVTSENFWKMQQLDIDSMSVQDVDSALNLVKMELRNDPQFAALSDQQFERYIKNKYKTLFDSAYDESDDEYQDTLLSLTVDANKAKGKLAELKQQYTLPKKNLAEIEAQEKARSEMQESYRRSVIEHLNGFDGSSVNLDGVELKFMPTNESKKFVQDSLLNGVLNGTYFADNYTSQDGTVDVARMSRDIDRVVNFETYIKAAFNQGKSSGKEEVVTDLKNPSAANPNAPAETSVEDAKSQAVAAFLQREFGK